jgi:hypothetical protein
VAVPSKGKVHPPAAGVHPHGSGHVKDLDCPVVARREDSSVAAVEGNDNKTCTKPRAGASASTIRLRDDVRGFGGASRSRRSGNDGGEIAVTA